MQAPDLDELYGADVRRANRRRLRVFLAVFLLVAVAGLVWDFSRSPEYRASARLQITPPVLTLADSKDGAAPPTSEQAFLTEVQTLSSRPLIEQVARRAAARRRTRPERPRARSDPGAAVRADRDRGRGHAGRGAGGAGPATRAAGGAAGRHRRRLPRAHRADRRRGGQAAGGGEVPPRPQHRLAGARGEQHPRRDAGPVALAAGRAQAADGGRRQGGSAARRRGRRQGRGSRQGQSHAGLARIARLAGARGAA